MTRSQLISLRVRQTRGRLVQQQKRRLEGQSAPELHPLLHCERKLARDPVSSHQPSERKSRIACAWSRHRGLGRSHGTSPYGFGYDIAGQPRVLSDEHVVEDGGLSEQFEVLKCTTNTVPGSGSGWVVWSARCRGRSHSL